MKRLGQTTVGVLAVAYVAIAASMMLYGRSTIDEGVYLGAARLVLDGAWLYRDFPFSQGPLVPYAYGAWLAAFGQDLLVGRSFSLLMAVAGTAAVARIAWTQAGRTGAALALLLSIVNLPALWVSATVRTQSLATPLTLLGMLALAAPRRGAFSHALAPSLLLWATSARLTEALALLAILAWVAWELRDRARVLLGVAAILGAQAVIAFLPLLLAPTAALFHVLVAQWSRGARGVGGRSSLFEDALAKVSVFLTPETSFFPVLPLGALLVAALVWRLRTGWRPDLSRPLGDPLSAQATLAATAILVLLPHLLLSAGFLTYFVTSSTLLTTAIAIALARATRSGAPQRSLALGATGAVLAVSVGLVPLQWSAWVGTGVSSIPHLRSVAREVRDLAGPDCTMLTMETTLAFQAGCRVLPGLEYSLFSYYADMSSYDAAAYGVLNTPLLRNGVRVHQPELIALGPRGSDALSEALGPEHTTGRIWSQAPPSLGALTPGGYTFHGRYRISSGAFVRAAPEHVGVAVFVRDDLRRSP